MKKDITLILSFFEGRDWNPLEGHNAIIEARLNKESLSTDCVPLTSCPKFNTDIIWQTDTQTIRKFKLNRIPIKVECFSVNEKSQKKRLGYIIVPLASAVEGLQVDPKWHKLLGGPNLPYKSPPSLLLRLSLEAMTLDQQNQVNGKHFLHTMKDQLIGEPKRPCLNVVIKSLADLSEAESGTKSATLGFTNGDASLAQGVQVAQQTACRPIEPANGVFIQEDCDVMDSDISEGEMVEEEEEEMEDEYISADENSDYETSGDSQQGMILNAYSLTAEDQQKIDNKETCRPQNSEVSSCPQTSQEKKELKPYSGAATVDALSGNKVSDIKKTSENNKELLNIRASARSHLLALSEKQLSNAVNRSDKYLSADKRILELSSSFEDNEQNFKSRKIDIAKAEYSFNAESKQRLQGNIIELSESLKNDSSQKYFGATSAAVSLSQSIGASHAQTENRKRSNSSDTAKPSQKQKLTAYLNQEMGFFQIGPETAFDEDFAFSVTILYAKNLDQVVAKGVIPSASKGFQFCYSLLGCSIYTDSFHSLGRPEFTAEKASAAIRSTPSALSEYFKQHSFLPVHLVTGEIGLALCTVDLQKLTGIDCENTVTLEGVFDMYKSSDNYAVPEISQSSAKLGISLELMRLCIPRSPTPMRSSRNYKISPRGNKCKMSCSFVDDAVTTTTGSSSDSDSERKNTHTRRKSRYRREGASPEFYRKLLKKNERRYVEADEEFEKYKMHLLNKAAKEVEDWKEQQQNIFRRELLQHEDALQKYVASECSEKIHLIERELNHRLSECDRLQKQLTLALDNLSVREKNIKSREDAIMQLEKELSDAKNRHITSDGSKNIEGSHASQNIETQKDVHQKKIEQLEHQVCRLQEEYVRSEETAKELTNETLSLRRQLIETNDLISVTKEKEDLAAKVTALQEKKQYYKTQWTKAISDLHKFHVTHKKSIDDIISDMHSQSKLHKPSSAVTVRSDTTSPASRTGYKLKKLKDERKCLLKSGLYAPDHSLIRNIDKKIQELVVGCERK